MERMRAYKSTTLQEVRQWIGHNLDEGVVCPACEQPAKLYKRSINSTMAKALVVAYQTMGREWFHNPTLSAQVDSRSSDKGMSKLRFWGLVEEEIDARPDGGRSGWWRITAKGEEFLRGVDSVPKRAVTYANRFVRFEGGLVDIHTALGFHFRYDELMEGNG